MARAKTTPKVRKPHAEHQHPQGWCMSCRWEAMSTEKQDAFRETARERGRRRWAAKNPDKAAVRVRLLNETSVGPCDCCGMVDQLNLPLVDYDAESIGGWRCRTCWSAARSDYRRKKAEPECEEMAA
jgi:hypothetical protein